jgi:hypothetical protein
MISDILCSNNKITESIFASLPAIHYNYNQLSLSKLLFPDLPILQSTLHMLIHHWPNALQKASRNPIRSHQTRNRDPDKLPRLLTSRYNRWCMRISSQDWPNVGGVFVVVDCGEDCDSDDTA